MSTLPTSPASTRPSDGRASALLCFLRLHWFARLRWVFVALAGLALLVDSVLAGGYRRPLALVVLVATLAAVNVVWRFVSRFCIRDMEGDRAATRHDVAAGRAFANAQIAVDLLLLTLIIRHSGGVESPLAAFYVFHMVVASLLLPRWQALLQGLWALVLYAALSLAELRGWLAPHYALLPGLAETGLHAAPGFVFVMVVAVSSAVLGTLYLALDIAAQLGRQEQALRRLQARIAEIQERRARFMRTAAHQLKGPLATIQTLAGLIRDRVVSGARADEVCEKIVGRCADGIQQVSELLTLARVQDSGRDGRGGAADVMRIAAEQCAQHEDLATANGIELRREVPAGSELYARVDPSDLSECVANLIENAIKYTANPGRVTVSVRGAAAPASEGAPQVAITVADTGMGIDPELLDPSAEGSIFDAFRRGDNALAAGIPGTGLGLAIVREVVERAGGRIQVESAPGRGARFTLLLPQASAAQ